MSEEAQITCAVALSGCSAWLSHMLELMPLLQFLAVIVAITSGCFAIAVSITKLVDWWKTR